MNALHTHVCSGKQCQRQFQNTRVRNGYIHTHVFILRLIGRYISQCKYSIEVFFCFRSVLVKQVLMMIGSQVLRQLPAEVFFGSNSVHSSCCGSLSREGLAMAWYGFDNM